MAQEPSFEVALQQALITPVTKFVEKLRRALLEPAAEDLRALLRQSYVEERRLASQLRAHATLMPNDLFRHTLDQIAVETERHAQLLAEQLQAQGDGLPTDNGQHPPEVQSNTTIWRLITTDMAAIGAVSHRYQEQLGWIATPAIQDLLHDLRTRKHRHRQQLGDLLARIDSYAKPEADRRHP